MAASKIFKKNPRDGKKNFCHKLNKEMETIREFIEEAVEEYNSGELTPKKLRDMLTTYEEVFKRVHKTNCYNM